MRVNLVAAVNPSMHVASGVRSYVLTLAEELASRQVEVTVLGFGPKARDSIPFEFVPVTERVGSASQYLIALSAFVRRAKRLEGVVHGNRPDDLVPFHLEAPGLRTVLTLHGAHGLHVRAKRGPLAATAYRLAERYSLEHARAVICVSPDTLTHFTRKYPRLQDRFRMIPAGVDMGLFRIRPRAEARARFRIPGDQKILAFVGRLEPEKNPTAVVEEVLALAQRRPDAHLVMVGGGRLAPTIRDLAQSTPNQLTLLDPMPQEELAWFLSAADVLVVASRHEGLPTVAIEALACGTPVVGTRVGILPEIVKAGANGFLVESPSELRFFMEKALYEMDWVGETCRASVRQVGWDRVTPAILEVYREISA